MPISTTSAPRFPHLAEGVLAQRCAEVASAVLGCDGEDYATAVPSHRIDAPRHLPGHDAAGLGDRDIPVLPGIMALGDLLR